MYAKRSKNVKFGFTLIELLVVIAIIAILAAILFPVFARARENARRASCQSNQKQVALGLKMYTSDFDEMFPPVAVVTTSANTNAPYNNPYGWADAIQGHLKSTQILQCPSEANTTHVNPQHVPATADPRGFTDYFFNYNVGGQSEGALAVVSNTIMTGCDITGYSRLFRDGDNVVNVRDTSDTQPDERAILDTGANNNGAAFRHLDGANYSFVDGHVKWLKPGSVMDDDTNPVNSYSFSQD